MVKIKVKKVKSKIKESNETLHSTKCYTLDCPGILVRYNDGMYRCGCCSLTTKKILDADSKKQQVKL